MDDRIETAARVAVLERERDALAHQLEEARSERRWLEAELRVLRKRPRSGLEALADVLRRLLTPDGRPR